MSASEPVPAAIAQYIPHRPPFLFVDEVMSFDGDKLTARLRARPEFDFFRGHYPDNPIMPGVIISEAVFQAGALLLARQAGEAGVRGVPVLTRIQDARFRSIVRPGDELTIEVRIEERMGRFCFMSGSVRTGDRRVMTIDFGVAMTEPEGSSSAGG